MLLTVRFRQYYLAKNIDQLEIYDNEHGLHYDFLILDKIDNIEWLKYNECKEVE